MRRLPQSLSTESLRLVWRASTDATRSMAGAAGVDGVSPAAFRSDLPDRIAELRATVREGTFKFGRLRMAKVPKGSGGYRIICIPTVRDRLLQRAILRHLEGEKRFNGTSDISYGFSKGRTLAAAQRRACKLRNNHPWMIQADIVRFFDQIPRAEVKALVRKRVGWKVVAGLVSAAVDCELELGSQSASAVEAEFGIRVGRGLRQGMPLSPVLSNLLLKGFDDELSTRGIPAIRYADDIAMFGTSEAACLDALAVAQAALSKLGLKLPELADHTKTKLARPSDAALFLGLEIKRFEDGYRLCAPTKKLDDIEASMAEAVSLAKCIKEKKNLGHVVRSLDSFVIGHAASMAVLEDGGTFRNLLEGRKQRQLRRLLSELIGDEVVGKLDDERMAVLGLRAFP